MKSKSKFALPTFFAAGTIGVFAWKAISVGGLAAIGSLGFLIILALVALLFAPWFALLAFSALNVNADDFLVRRIPWGVRMSYADVAAVDAGVGGFFPHPRVIIRDKQNRRAVLDYDAFHEDEIAHLLRVIRHNRPDLNVPPMPPRDAHLRR